MKDPRLAVAEIALGLLKEVPQKMIRSIDLKGLAAEVKTLSFSFMSLEELNDQGMLVGLVSYGQKLKEVWEEWKDRAKTPGDRLALAKVRFASIIFGGIQERVGRRAEIFYGTDSYWGRLVDVKEFNGLRKTVVEAKERFDVVTNMTVSRGDLLAFAILPPKRFGDYVSEGMFFEAEGEGQPGSVPIPTGRGAKSVESVLREEAARLNIKI